MNKLLILSFTLLIVVPSLIKPTTKHVPPGPYDWKLAKNKNNVKVYTREKEGSDFKEFKAITTVTATMSQVQAVLNDVESYTEWIADMKSSVALKTISPNERIDRYELDLPWPFEDRDMIMHYKLTQDTKNKSTVIILKGKADYIPHKKGFIRMKSAKGFWKITPKSSTETIVKYQFVADPSGSLPAWVVNMFIVDGPYKTLTALKEKVKEEQYAK